MPHAADRTHSRRTITLARAEREYDVARSTIRHWDREGHVEILRGVGRQDRIRVEDLERAIGLRSSEETA